MHHGHVACEFVMTCSFVARSNQALLRMPWWPGNAPVMIDVWLARVTVGSDAIAPCPNPVPISINRATFGTSPRATMSYSTFAFVPSNRNPMTWRGRSFGSSTSSITRPS